MKDFKRNTSFFFYFDDNMTHLNRFSFGKILHKKKEMSAAVVVLDVLRPSFLTFHFSVMTSSAR